MAYWLFKSEPETWSWDDQWAKGAAGEPWDGVRNYQARNNMRAMQVGDLGFFYHSVKEKRIVGVVQVIAASAPDPTTGDPRWDCVTVQAIKPVPRPVTLTQIKAEPRLSEAALLKQSRLSVQPVRKDEWRLICDMAGLQP